MDYMDIIIGLGGALFGGLFREVIDRCWSHADKRIDAAAKLRDELWGEIHHLREQIHSYSERIDELERQGNDWREKYFELLGRYNRLEAQSQLNEARCEALEREISMLRNLVSTSGAPA